MNTNQIKRIIKKGNFLQDSYSYSEMGYNFTLDIYNLESDYLVFQYTEKKSSSKFVSEFYQYTNELDSKIIDASNSINNQMQLEKIQAAIIDIIA